MNYAHALLGFLRKFWFFCDKDTQTYLRSKKNKIYQKAAAAPLGFGQNKPNCVVAAPINSLAIASSQLSCRAWHLGLF